VLKLAVVGFGAIGQELARRLLDDPAIRITQVVVSARSVDAVRALLAALAPHARVSSVLDMASAQRPDALAECAGHEAVRAHVMPALDAGVPCVLASVGALHRADDFTRLEAAAARGRTTVRLISGAIGGIDALQAAGIGGLDRVRYVGTKPPRSWLGTPAERVCDLAALASPFVIFKGSAREAAVAYPKNANVAATVGLAGVGLDRTEVELVADPGAVHNMHSLTAHGAFGRLEMRLENLPLPDNPKSSALAVYSLARAVRNLAAPVLF
jgi:aspartate dehydrogenase